MRNVDEERLAYYERVYAEHAEAGWDNAPGKEVILAVLRDVLHKPDVGACAIVDIGCGTGFLLDRIQREISDRCILHGVDFSARAIARGRSLYPQLLLHCGDGGATGLEASAFDILISYGSMEHFPQPEQGIAEAARLLRPGGLFFVMLPTLGAYRTDREDEGWYEDLTGQLQWNWKRDTWEGLFDGAGLRMWPLERAAEFGACKPGMFYFGEKPLQVPSR